MANVDRPRGLVPLRDLSGAPYNGAVNKYYVPASDSTAIYVGGLVKLGGTADANGVASVTGNVATGDAVLGAVISVDPIPATLPRYRAASTERYVYVSDDPNLVYEVQADDVLALTAVGNSADLTGFTAGNTTTGLSSIEVDASTATAAGDGTQDVVIVGFAQTPDNDPASANANVLVRLNNHAFVDGFAGA